MVIIALNNLIQRKWLVPCCWHIGALPTLWLIDLVGFIIPYQDILALLLPCCARVCVCVCVRACMQVHFNVQFP